MRRVVAAGASALACLFSTFLPAGLGSLPARSEDPSALSCCADLEERIAELEATTARSGNSKLSLRMYGQVNRALLMWNDGFNSGNAVVDNHTSSSRFGFIGQAGIKPGLTAGYRFEIEAPFPSSDEIFNGPGGGTAALGSERQLRVRQSYWTLTSRELGSVSTGFQSPATDDVTLINLGSQMNDAAVHYNNAFRIRLDLAKPAIMTDLTWGDIAHNVDSLRGNFVRYDTPILGGFLVSAAWNSDVWDVAARYQKEWNEFQFASGIGYMKDEAREFEDVRGSASLIHNPTGLYASVAGGVRNAKHALPGADGEPHFYYLQLGISKQWLSYGKTTIYADYGLYRNFNTGELLSINPDTSLPVVWGTLTETEVRRRGFGVEQAFDAAALLVYAQAHFYDPTIVGYPCDFLTPTVCGGNPANTTRLPAGAWQGFVVGARVQF